MSAMPKPLPDSDAVPAATMTPTKNQDGNYALPMTRRAMTPQEQLLALRRLQAQAEHRVKLGVQLFKATEAYTSRHQTMLKEFKAEQETLREEMQSQMAQSLRSYDQWVGQIEKSTEQKLEEISRRLDQLQADWRRAETRMETTLKRVETLLEQSRTMLDRPLVPDFLPDESTPATAAFVNPPVHGAAALSRHVPATPDEMIDTGQLYAQMVQRLKNSSPSPDASSPQPPRRASQDEPNPWPLNDPQAS